MNLQVLEVQTPDISDITCVTMNKTLKPGNASAGHYPNCSWAMQLQRNPKLATGMLQKGKGGIDCVIILLEKPFPQDGLEHVCWVL